MERGRRGRGELFAGQSFAADRILREPGGAGDVDADGVGNWPRRREGTGAADEQRRGGADKVEGAAKDHETRQAR